MHYRKNLSGQWKPHPTSHHVIISMLSELTVTENYTGLQSINSISVVKFQVGSK